MAYSPDGNTLASGSWDGTIKLWDVGPDAVRPATLVVIAAPRRIGREWRLVIAGERIIAGSQYAVEGSKCIESGTSWPSCARDRTAAARL